MWRERQMNPAIARTMKSLHPVAKAVKRLPGPVSDWRVESPVGEAITECGA